MDPVPASDISISNINRPVLGQVMSSSATTQPILIIILIHIPHPKYCGWMGSSVPIIDSETTELVLIPITQPKKPKKPHQVAELPPAKVPKHALLEA